LQRYDSKIKDKEGNAITEPEEIEAALRRSLDDFAKVRLPGLRRLGVFAD
jgi:hypothetical protein